MRNLGLDILRFLAVFLVIIRHAPLLENSNKIIKIWYTGGWIGVDLFFVISGFLISNLLFKEVFRTGSVDPKRFLIRRAFKIYPPFWILSLFAIIVFSLTKQSRSSSQIITEFLFLQNYWPGLWLYTWSLAVEEHFYFGMAALFWLLKRFNISKAIRVIPAICVLTCILCLYLRYEKIIGASLYNHAYYNYQTHFRIDSLCFGVLLSYLVNFKRFGSNWSTPFSLGIVFIGFLLLSPGFIYQVETERWILIWGVTLFYIGSGCLVLGALKLGSSQFQLLRLLGVLGATSYSIYLWHMPVKAWLTPMLVKVIGVYNPPFLMGVYLTGSFGLGWAMHLLIERPSLWLRNRVYKDNQIIPEPPMSHFDSNLNKLTPISTSL